MTNAIAAKPASQLPLLAATFALAVAGLVYELLAGTVSAYLLGSSVYQFSIVIGLFMSAMGIGAWLSRLVDEPKRAFIMAQIALGIVGGTSALMLFLAYVVIDNYNAFLFLICIAAGTLVGLEIPLVTRILEAQSDSLRVNISNILTADYIGALAAAVLFPLVLVPQLGLIQTGLLLGTLNLLVAGLAIQLFKKPLLWWACAPLIAVMLLLMVWSGTLTNWIETRLFDSEIVYTETTPYQRLVVTKSGERTRLFINGNLQFDTIDEHRYHEALVHPVMSMSPRIENVLVLGGGDGMAAREVLRYDDVRTLTLVDLDPAMTRLFRDTPTLSLLNDRSLSDQRVAIINTDAWQFTEKNQNLFDVVIIDLPDPHSLDLSKLYSLDFYQRLSQRLTRHALIVTQSTSPVFAREAFWSIHETLAATPAPFALNQKLETLPYHAYVPSFGDWGFVMAGSRITNEPVRATPTGLQFVDPAFLESASQFADDSAKLPVEVNTILDHPLLAYYEQGWSRWFGP